MEANGWKNIRFRGYLQGESVWRASAAKVPDIAAFSELGKFLGIPLRYYSAGMMVRLAFSAATAIEPEILLVDEVLGAGDLAFQRKAQQRMHEMMEKARILVVVSHDMNVLPRLQKSARGAFWLDKGRLRGGRDRLMKSSPPMSNFTSVWRLAPRRRLTRGSRRVENGFPTSPEPHAVTGFVRARRLRLRAGWGNPAREAA